MGLTKESAVVADLCRPIVYMLTCGGLMWSLSPILIGCREMMLTFCWTCSSAPPRFPMSTCLTRRFATQRGVTRPRSRPIGVVFGCN
ncbi:hypothetical protein N658DRAFT_347777 [Parathielavia hyrcaniae]|uniref:Uncharacterized protein n=1 Tax=Parathielavia hyrcaniae TaxID=113614 RepID=A0AAN6PVY5_9PEZI|nr:hypothetical protein N658DRAFT_347777 [Parathielavia hyrcaniae]